MARRPGQRQRGAADAIGDVARTARAGRENLQVTRAGDSATRIGATINTTRLACAIQHQCGHDVGGGEVQFQRATASDGDGGIGGEIGIREFQRAAADGRVAGIGARAGQIERAGTCLLYTSDAADE